jgi:hypothetical protein
MDKRNTLLINYLSLYNGYLYVCANNTLYEDIGYSYSDVHENPLYSGVLTYEFLKRKRIHNLKYYDLVENSDDIYQRKYELKEGVNLYRIGATYERKDIACIKIL